MFFATTTKKRENQSVILMSTIFITFFIKTSPMDFPIVPLDLKDLPTELPEYTLVQAKLIDSIQNQENPF